MDLQTKLIDKCLSEREAGLTASILDDLDNPCNLYTLLALFCYDVQEGGFAQFVYNSNGVYLVEVAQALEAVEADNTGLFLERVINLCLDEDKLYKKFLASDGSDGFFKRKLDKISEEYLRCDEPLIVEAEESLIALISQCEAD
ncbi:uncharacterized protein DUF4375 [Sinobacterium caligoides]|uniref:Uncharacterized protein DUF4375 n=1 Tax=Sinobacterium caligoides TaxID=933926 RepID=A0A3N2DDX8_9GAMM|nr:DUF4375 domain-containing protein [Sinobacterium caligoides]ROR97983.1 uncharacterized protein DUF4375 [Sinobacterium caligoides]